MTVPGLRRSFGAGRCQAVHEECHDPKGSLSRRKVCIDWYFEKELVLIIHKCFHHIPGEKDPYEHCEKITHACSTKHREKKGEEKSEDSDTPVDVKLQHDHAGAERRAARARQADLQDRVTVQQCAHDQERRPSNHSIVKQLNSSPQDTIESVVVIR